MQRPLLPPPWTSRQTFSSEQLFRDSCQRLSCNSQSQLQACTSYPLFFSSQSDPRASTAFFHSSVVHLKSFLLCVIKCCMGRVFKPCYSQNETSVLILLSLSSFVSISFPRGLIGISQHAVCLILLQEGITVFRSRLLCSRFCPALSFLFLRCCWPDKRLRPLFLCSVFSTPSSPLGLPDIALCAPPAPAHCRCTRACFGLTVLCFLYQCWIKVERSTLKSRMEEQVLEETGGRR